MKKYAIYIVYIYWYLKRKYIETSGKMGKENIKEINIKNRTYYFFDDIINIKNFDSNLLKIDKKSYKNIDIYHIGCITMKGSNYVNIHSVNPLYFIIGEVEGYIEEKMEINT